MDSNWAIVILTIVLVVVTGYYALQTRRLADDTRRMADVMALDYERKVTPLVQVKLGTFMHTVGRYSIGVRISNFGAMPVKLDRFELMWWLSDRVEKVNSKKFKYNETIDPGTKDKEISFDLHDEEIVAERQDLKARDNWVGILHNLIRYQVRMFYWGRNPLIPDVLDTPPSKSR